MALIKCPECNKDVSTEASSCPNCGYPIAKKIVKNNRSVAPKPINSEWLSRWNNKPVLTKFMVFGSFLISLVFLIIFSNLYNSDLVKEYDYFGDVQYYNKDIYLFPISIFGFLALFLFIASIISLFMVKIFKKNIDGYNMVVYIGFWKNYLMIEDEFHDSNWGSIFHNTLLSDALPNGKQVIATLSSGSVTFKVELTPNHISNFIEPVIVQNNDTKGDLLNKTDDITPDITTAFTESNAEKANEIIYRINEDLLLLSEQTDKNNIEELKKIIKSEFN